jgi:transcriptional regulator with XRE-family HTH domain
MMTRLITDKLRQLIREAEARGESRHAIAQRAGISDATLSRFMAGRGIRSYCMALTLATALNHALVLVDVASGQ